MYLSILVAVSAHPSLIHSRLPSILATGSFSGTGRLCADSEDLAGTKELVQVQQGTILVNVANQSVTLAAGDAVAFPGDVTHAYANPGPQPARFSLAVFEPGVGSDARSDGADA